MKIFKFFKNIPFLLTLIIFTILYINNQKEYTKLKLLIWSTPPLSLGTYISISAGTGYLLSYVFTTTLSKAYKSKSEPSIRYKYTDEENKTNYYQQPSSEINYDNTLIERDIKDPAPTVKANFRVIGKSNRKIELSENYLNNEYDSPYNFNDLNSKYVGNDSNNDLSSTSNDWDDDNFINW
mgnify:CR=1 FL=1|tara:strand:+ start:51 stop:593 length:543 start_codon:yes stop_codon:yes gene_type:complete